jgi:hypothetical protein
MSTPLLARLAGHEHHVKTKNNEEDIAKRYVRPETRSAPVGTVFWIFAVGDGSKGQGIAYPDGKAYRGISGMGITPGTEIHGRLELANGRIYVVDDDGKKHDATP